MERVVTEGAEPGGGSSVERVEMEGVEPAWWRVINGEGGNSRRGQESIKIEVRNLVVKNFAYGRKCIYLTFTPISSSAINTYLII